MLLLHGWGDNIKGLSNLQADLESKYKVVALDLPGFGETQPPKEVWDLDNYADFVAAFLQKLELPAPLAIIGHSNGGALAIRGLASNKLSANKLVLLAASGIRTGKSFKRFALVFLAKLGNMATIWMPERYRGALRKSLYDTAGSDLLTVPGLEDTFKKTVRQDVQHDAAALLLPTLLIYAKNDEAVPIKDAYTYQKLIDGSKLEVIDEAGHFLHHDQPEKITNHIREFIK